jgi:hypothetical protein
VEVLFYVGFIPQRRTTDVVPIYRDARRSNLFGSHCQNQWLASFE